MVEYALLAGFLAVAAGALLPEIGEEILAIFKRTTLALAQAAGRGRAGFSPTGTAQPF